MRPIFVLCLLGFNSVLSYLPETDLTNSIYSRSGDGSHGDEGEEVTIIGGVETSAEGEDSPYRTGGKQTFRRRNINRQFPSGPSPFNRMAYKSGYGSIRSRGGNNFRSRNSMYMNNNYPSNSYGSNYAGDGDSSYLRPMGFSSSGLMGKRKMGYFGSSAGRNMKMNRPVESFNQNNFPSNDLSSSFNSIPMQNNYNYNTMNGRFPFRNSGTFIPRNTESGRYPDSSFSPYESSYPSSYRDLDPYNIEISSNSWNGKPRMPSKDNVVIDGYADAKKTKKSKTKTF